MGAPIEIVRLGHTMHVGPDLGALRELYMNAFGAIIFHGGHGIEEDHDLNLLYVADCMMEPLAPARTVPGKPLAQYLDRYGPGFQSVQFEIKDFHAAEARCRELGVATVNPIGSEVYFFLHPKASHGLFLMLRASKMPNDPAEYAGWRPDWIRGHPSSLLRLSSLNFAVSDRLGARFILTEALGGRLLHEDRVETPEPMDRTFVEVGGAVFGLLEPLGGNGPVSYAIKTRAPGLYSMTWLVESIARAEAHLASKNLATTTEGLVTGSLGIDPAGFFGARHEFTTTEPFSQPLPSRQG
jgi:hypothetical protein